MPVLLKGKGQTKNAETVKTSKSSIERHPVNYLIFGDTLRFWAKKIVLQKGGAWPSDSKTAENQFFGRFWVIFRSICSVFALHVSCDRKKFGRFFSIEQNWSKRMIRNKVDWSKNSRTALRVLRCTRRVLCLYPMVTLWNLRPPSLAINKK